MSQQGQSQTKIKVLVVEDQEVMRFSLKASLLKFQQLEIVGEATTGREAVENTIALRPDVVIMDIGLPEMNGLEATRHLKDLELPCKIVMLTSFDDAEQTLAALAAGADAYCVKNIPVQDLVRAISSVHAGRSWLDPKVAGFVVKISNLTLPDKEPENLDLVEAVEEKQFGLTEKEMLVLKALVQGKTDTEIAQFYGTTDSVIASLIKALIAKLAAANRNQIILMAKNKGII
jgi:DNA-binding NarL/FixJ family response regulator